MTEQQLILLRDWFREEVEYLIKVNLTPEKINYYNEPADYYANRAFDKVVDEFCGNEND